MTTKPSICKMSVSNRVVMAAPPTNPTTSTIAPMQKPATQRTKRTKALPVGGAVLVKDEELAERIRFVKNTGGGTQSPFEAWLTLKGLKTLELRLERHSRNALEVARFLERQPAVRSVAYPWLDSFPQHELARRQQRDGGGLLAFELEGGAEAGRRLMESLELCSLAENLGAAETLVTHPATMTHASVPEADRQRVGIHDGLVRLSVGLEDPRDLIADLAQALERAAQEACRG